jgi:hypothetical protein
MFIERCNPRHVNECAEGLFKFSARELPNKGFLFMVDKTH